MASRADDTVAVSHTFVADLHVPQPWIYWTDLLVSAAVGWSAFALAVTTPFSAVMLLATIVAGAALYRGLCFTHELAHLRRRAMPGFELTWNILFGVPLLLPSFTYLGVHQSHHSLSTYGTKDDPEYLPFASSRRMTIIFALQSILLLPLAMVLRFLVISPLALVWPRLHRWLEVHASSFAMNPEYRRAVGREMARKMKRWELAILVFWGAAIGSMYAGVLPLQLVPLWLAVLVIISFLNTARVLAAHEYDSDGSARSRHGQLADSIDTPGGPWTELWAPVGLRYHALHHYFPGIPYHNLRTAYQRIVRSAPGNALYLESTSPSLRRSLAALSAKARSTTRLLSGGDSRSTVPGVNGDSVKRVLTGVSLSPVARGGQKAESFGGVGMSPRASSAESNASSER
jgi:fatty acid desaturase